jgi:hypothetical protein
VSVESFDLARLHRIEHEVEELRELAARGGALLEGARESYEGVVTSLEEALLREGAGDRQATLELVDRAAGELRLLQAMPADARPAVRFERVEVEDARIDALRLLDGVPLK